MLIITLSWKCEQDDGMCHHHTDKASWKSADFAMFTIFWVVFDCMSQMVMSLIDPIVHSLIIFISFCYTNCTACKKHNNHGDIADKTGTYNTPSSWQEIHENAGKHDNAKNETKIDM